MWAGYDVTEEQGRRLPYSECVVSGMGGIRVSDETLEKVTCVGCWKGGKRQREDEYRVVDVARKFVRCCVTCAGDSIVFSFVRVSCEVGQTIFI